ncbi:MAG: cytidine deaminase [Gemmatimonadota bacterium]|nr:cytidine deaminase [Gemmatimonadota bacterium]
MSSHVPLRRLKELARAMWRRSYAPYSRYRVGAALETESGAVFTGCNVENASYGLTICAERGALAAAVAQGHRSFRRLVVATEGDQAVAPCGACRQVLAEFGTRLEVHGIGTKENRRWTLQELIPEVFVLTDD